MLSFLDNIQKMISEEQEKGVTDEGAAVPDAAA